MIYPNNLSMPVWECWHGFTVIFMCENHDIQLQVEICSFFHPAGVISRRPESDCLTLIQVVPLDDYHIVVQVREFVLVARVWNLLNVLRSDYITYADTLDCLVYFFSHPHTVAHV